MEYIGICFSFVSLLIELNIILHHKLGRVRFVIICCQSSAMLTEYDCSRSTAIKRIAINKLKSEIIVIWSTSDDIYLYNSIPNEIFKLIVQSLESENVSYGRLINLIKPLAQCRKVTSFARNTKLYQTDEAKVSETQPIVVSSAHQQILCHATGCCNLGTLKCGKCKIVRYCSKECQKVHWSTHKLTCKKDKTADSKRLRINIACSDEPDEFIDVLPIGTKVSLISTGRPNGELYGRIVGFLPGKGPFANPEVKLDPELLEHKMFLRSIDIDDDVFCMYSIQMEESGEVLAVECSEFYIQWKINSETIISANPDSIYLDSVVNIASSFMYSSKPRVLLVSNFGYFESSNCIYSQAIQAQLCSKTIPFDTLDFEGMEELCQKLQLGIYAACVMIGVGSAGPEGLKNFDNNVMKQTLKSWTLKVCFL